MKQCKMCNKTLDLSNFYVNPKTPDGYRRECKDCSREHNYHQHKRNNPKRMWVNGKYIPMSHPLHKPGRYKTLDDAWSHVEIDQRSKEGDVYIIANAAWPHWYKVGKAVSSQDRLNGYQTSSPYRDYSLIYCQSFDNRHTAESAVHKELRSRLDEDSYNGEWFSASLDAIIDIIEGVKYEEANTGHRNEPEPQHDLDLCNSGC